MLRIHMPPMYHARDGVWLLDSALYAPDVVWLCRNTSDNPFTEAEIKISHREHDRLLDKKEKEYK